MAPPAPRRRVLSALLFVFLLPWRAIALFLLAVLVVPGVVMMWRLPPLARDNDFDLCLLTLRVIDRERAAAPLAPLGYRAAVDEHLTDLTPDLGWPERLVRDFTLRLYRTDAASVEPVRAPGGGWHYHVRYHNGSARQVAFTTPHLNVPPGELAEARAAVARVFRTERELAEVRQWGESLFWTEWLRTQPLSSVPYDRIPAPAGGTPDEQVWLAWTVLRGADPAAGEELDRLPELVAAAFPDAADRVAARAWARGLYDRLEADFRSYQGYVRAWPGYKAGARGTREEILAACDRVLPPRSAWTDCWLLYRYVGLTDRSRAAALAHWRGCFPERRHAAVVAFGERVLAERRAAAEPLPPVPGVLPWLCAVERVTGTDPYGGRCRAALDREYGLEYFPMLRNGVLVANPNDDFFYLEAAADPLHLYPNASAGATWEGKVLRLGNSVCFIAVIQLGVGTLVALAARALTRGRSRELWRKHAAGRGKRSWWLALVGVLAAAAVGALAAPGALEDSMVLHVDTYPELFAAAVAATLAGGVLIGTCRRVVAVALVAAGVDVERTWLDEVLGILVGGLILHHFGASLVAVALFAAAGLVPVVVRALRSRPQPQPAADAPAPVPARPVPARPVPTVVVGDTRRVPGVRRPVR